MKNFIKTWGATILIAISFITLCAIVGYVLYL